MESTTIIQKLHRLIVGMLFITYLSRETTRIHCPENNICCIILGKDWEGNTFDGKDTY